MRSNAVARSYAGALFELGERHGSHEGFAEAAERLEQLLAESPRARVFLESPQIDAEAKKDVLKKALGSRVPPLFLNFVLLVIDKRRQRMLPAILEEYRARTDEQFGRVHVQVTLARDPDERMEEDVTSELSRLLGKTVIPHVRVDPAILGGVIVRFGDQILDGSLRRQLMAMRRAMVNAELPSA